MTAAGDTPVGAAGGEATTLEERFRIAVRCAQSIGRAWRMDWSDFDGRTLRSQLNDLDEIVNGTWDEARYRATVGLCPLGKDHWDDNCIDFNCEAAAASSTAP